MRFRPNRIKQIRSSNMIRKIITASFIVAFLLSGCDGLNASSLTVEVINQDDIVLSQDLKIRVCFPAEIKLSELAVNVYVTEREEWGNLKEVSPYTHYFNEQFVSIPGTISKPISEALWQASGNFCYTAYLENTFVDTNDWIEQGVCPFKGIVVVANYQKGAWNAAKTFECQISN